MVAFLKVEVGKYDKRRNNPVTYPTAINTKIWYKGKQIEGDINFLSIRIPKADSIVYWNFGFKEESFLDKIFTKLNLIMYKLKRWKWIK